MIKLRLTVTVDYIAEPDWYDTHDPEKMCAIDLANYEANIEHVMEMIDTKDAKITVTPIMRTIRKEK